MNKPREFWLEQLDDHDCILHTSDEKLAYKAPEQILHVIDYEAYEEIERNLSGAQAEIKRLNEQIVEGSMPPETYKILCLEVERLRTKNERLKAEYKELQGEYCDLAVHHNTLAYQLQSEREKNAELYTELGNRHVQIKKLRAALEFYAEEPTYDLNGEIQPNGPEKARSVLAEIGDEK